MSNRPPLNVLEHDVFALTRRGELQIRDADTSVPTPLLNLLVRVDGVLSVAEIAKGGAGRSPDSVLHGFERLLHDGLIAPAPKPEPDSLDFTNFFALKDKLEPGADATKRAVRQVAAGVASLKRHGYFVRIARRARPPGAQPGHPGKPRAVVVEDEPHLAKLLKHFLSLEGFDPRVAGNRLEILDALRQPPLPDIVLLDVVLPDADGFDVLMRMRQHPALKRVPVIMLTSKATRESVLRGLAGGADGYITKPFDVDALAKAMHTVLGRPAP
jgi:two-component system, OmpR family, response regulator